MTRREVTSALMSTVIVSSTALGTLALVLSVGCTSSTPPQLGSDPTAADADVQDWRRGDGRCAVHHQKMDTVTVHRIAGPGPQMSPQYYEAKEKGFPNCGIEYPPSMYGKERGKIYVCPVCEANRKAWAESR